MNEFKNTKNAALTLEQFKAIESEKLVADLQGGQDPPAFIRNLKKYQAAITEKIVEETTNQINNEEAPANFKESIFEMTEEEPVSEIVEESKEEN